MVVVIDVTIDRAGSSGQCDGVGAGVLCCGSRPKYAGPMAVDRIWSSGDRFSGATVLGDGLLDVAPGTSRDPTYPRSLEHLFLLGRGVGPGAVVLAGFCRWFLDRMDPNPTGGMGSGSESSGLDRLALSPLAGGEIHGRACDVGGLCPCIESIFCTVVFAGSGSAGRDLGPVQHQL